MFSDYVFCLINVFKEDINNSYYCKFYKIEWNWIIVKCIIWVDSFLIIKGYGDFWGGIGKVK